jgi:hypothetical protein
MARKQIHKPQRPFDFDYDQEFYDSLDEDDLHRYERYLYFFPIVCLRVLYIYLDQIMDKKLAEIKQVWLERGFSKYIPVRDLKENEIQAPIYRLMWAIMVNDIETVRRLAGEIDINRRIFNYLLFAPFELCVRPLEKDIDGLNPVTISASLGRHEIFQFLIENGGEPKRKVVLISVKAQFIYLSVNECLLMNTIFHWYKSGRKTPISPDQANKLIDLIILASRKCPSLVSYDHLIENTIRTTWYWGELKEMVGDLDIVKRLVPLNPPVINELLYL